MINIHTLIHIYLSLSIYMYTYIYIYSYIFTHIYIFIESVLERKSISLMLLLRLNHGEFITDVCCKPTDGHQYLHFKSCHPSHTKSSIIFSQALHMKIICNKRSDLVANVRKLKDWFRGRGHPEDMVNKETNRALETPSLGCSKTYGKSVPGSGGT